MTYTPHRMRHLHMMKKIKLSQQVKTLNESVFSDVKIVVSTESKGEKRSDDWAKIY